MDAIHVQAPDGSIIQFPAGTPDSTINSVMSREYGNASRASNAQREAPAASGFDAMGNATGATSDVQAPPPQMPYRDQLSHALGAIDNGIRAVGNGIPFMDRIAAAGGAATGVGGTFGDYSGNLERERARNKSLEESAPLANTAAHFVGGALIPVGAAASAATRTGLLAKSLMSARTGAGIGVAQGLSDTQDLTDVSDAAKNASIGGGAGFAIGGVLPGAGRLIGKGYNALADALLTPEGISRGASRHLIDALLADGPQAVQQRMGRLGPDAMLADAGHSLQGKASGAALNNDGARSTVFSALKGRDEGTNQRIMDDVNRVLGPAEDPQTVTKAIRAQRSEVDSKAYPAALTNSPPVKIDPVMADLADKIAQAPAGSMEHRALTNLQKMLTREEQKAPSAAASVAPAAPAAEDATTAALRSKYGDAVADAYAKQGSKAQAEKPQSLLEFIASKGGLGPDAELEAIGGLGHTVNVEGVGRRKLVKQGGWPLDYAREAAEEAGYIQGNHKGTSTVNDLLDAIDAEMRGQKRYPQGFEGHVGKREGVARSEREQHEYDRLTQGLEADLENAGHGQIGPDVKERAIGLMRDKGLHPDEAVDHAVAQLENESSFPGNKPLSSRPNGQAGATPHDSANILHKIKGELDNIIEYDAPGLGVPAGALQRQQAALKQVRGAINDALERQVPGYREANRQSASLAKRGEAVEAGTQYLGSGKTTPSPDRFAAEFGPRSQGEKIAFAKGSRGNIERILGTKANDLQALRGELQGEGGWNTAKIGTVHGQEAADELAASVDRNLKFRDTHNKVVENAQTAQRTAAKEAMAPQPPGEMPLLTPQTTGVGLALGGAKKALSWAYKNIQPDQTRHYGEIARVVTAQGSERDRHLAALIEALDKHGQIAQASPAIGNRAALAAALLGNEYLHGRSGAR